MKNVKFRINADLIINLIGALILFAGGLCMLLGCMAFMAELSDGWKMLDVNNELEKLLALFVVPVLIMLYVLVFIISVVVGFIPATLGFIIGALSMIARFAHTEKGTTITKSYKTLMTVANIMTCSTFGLYAMGIISLIIAVIAHDDVHINLS